MNLEEMKVAFQVLQFLLTGGIGFYVYMSNKDKVTNDRITQMADVINKRFGELERDVDMKSDQHAERISSLEAQAKLAPTHDDLGKVYDKISVVSDCVKRSEGQLTAIDKNLQLIQEHLLRGHK